jgi:hypothetical protein
MKSNGVSGHYYYISYQILLTYFLACLYFGGGRNHYRFRMLLVMNVFRMLYDLEEGQ